APSAAATNWRQIVALYDTLLALSPSPVVELNRAVAVAMRDGPAAGLMLVEAILHRGDLGDYHLAHAARADLLRRLGRPAGGPAGLRAGAGSRAASAGASLPPDASRATLTPCRSSVPSPAKNPGRVSIRGRFVRLLVERQTGWALPGQFAEDTMTRQPIKTC